VPRRLVRWIRALARGAAKQTKQAKKKNVTVYKSVQTTGQSWKCAKTAMMQ